MSTSSMCVSGVEGAVIIGKLLEKTEAEGTSATLGYNAATDTYEDLVKAGIIDPLKVVSAAACLLPGGLLISKSALEAASACIDR